MGNISLVREKYRVIVWGFKPVNGVVQNTISYVWESFYKAFSNLGFETYWFPNEKIEGFNFENCIFLCEGYDDSNIPIEESSIYYVHCAYDPIKYVGKVGRFIDLRYNLNNIDHPNYIYTLDKVKSEKIGKGCYYEPSSGKMIEFKNGRVSYSINDFEKVYVSWATDLLPSEIDENDVYLEREKKIYFLGSLCADKEFYNIHLIEEFANECRKSGIEFIINPFGPNTQLSNYDYIKKSKESLLGFDLRCERAASWGQIACRIFKNMSYGHLGLTNTLEAYNELEGHCLYSSSPSDLFHMGMERREDYNYIKDGLKYIREHHTYINRVESLISII
jgi:hypothetical protein